MAQLYGAVPWHLFRGETMAGSSNSSGTQVTRSSPSLFNQLVAGANFLGGL